MCSYSLDHSWYQQGLVLASSGVVPGIGIVGSLLELFWFLGSYCVSLLHFGV